MLGATLGEYRIESELGSGGMGVVYLATVAVETAGLPVGSRVAVKVVHPHLLAKASGFRSLAREARVGCRVSHENVVRSFGAGAGEVGDQTVRYLVMEYVEGRTLRDLLDDLVSVPEALVREIALQVAAGLEAIHEAGIVHRDLKPENVLITDDQQVRIMDLGVAKLFEESANLTAEGQFVGSLSYAAPEQIRGEEVCPGADLYSLGVLLYELATGVNPFLRERPVATLQAHLQFEARAAADRNPDVSPFLSEVIRKLLSKDVSDRFTDASLLRDVLREGEGSEWWAEREREILRLAPSLPSIPVRRETAVYGREVDLAILRESFAAASRGEGCSLLVEGEAGIGKTRLLALFLAELDAAGAHVLYGSYAPSGGLGGLSDAIMGRFGASDLEPALRPYLAATPSLVPAFAAMVRHLRPPTGSEPVSGDAISSIFCQLMSALAEEKPLVWIVDDLHFAHPDSRRIVTALARAVEGRRILLLLTARPGVPEDELAALSRLENHRRVGLRRLGAREVIELLRDAFQSEELAVKLGGRIALKSDGIPFFVFEMIRGLREGRFIRQMPDGTFVETQVIEKIEVPSAVRDLIEARLSGLGKEDRALLDVAAVQGFVFSPGLVADVVGRKRIRVLQDLADLERRLGVVRGRGPDYAFDHHQIQEVLYEDLHEGLRREYHTALAEAFSLQTAAGDRKPEELPGEASRFLAAHHLRGSRPRDGLPHLPNALRHLEASYRNDAAVELADRALGIDGLLEGKDRVDVLDRKADALGVLGRRAEQEEALREALGIVEESGESADRARVLLALGSIALFRSRYLEALERIEAARTLAEEAGHRSLANSALGTSGIVRYYLGEMREAQSRFEAVLAYSLETGDLVAESKSRGNLGNISLALGHYAEARAQYARDLAISERLGNRRQMSVAVGNVGGTFEAEGRLADALERYRTQLDLAHETGDRHGEAVALVNLGPLFATLGDWSRAREHLEACLAMCRQIDARRVEGYARHGLGQVAEQTGDVAAASLHYEEALALRREIGYRMGRGETLLALGSLHLAMGEEAPARRCLEEARALGEELDSPDLSVGAAVRLARLEGGDAGAALEAFAAGERLLWHTARMEALFLLFKVTGDGGFLAQSRRLLRFLCDHAPADRRDTMITEVPLHRGIVAADPGSGATTAS